MIPQKINVCSCHLSFCSISIYRGYLGDSLALVPEKGEGSLDDLRLLERPRKRSIFVDPTKTHHGTSDAALEATSVARPDVDLSRSDQVSSTS